MPTAYLPGCFRLSPKPLTTAKWFPISGTPTFSVSKSTFKKAMTSVTMIIVSVSIVFSFMTMSGAVIVE